eukprot:3498256-Alexandrium_andersonii.AAC.1
MRARTSDHSISQESRLRSNMSMRPRAPVSSLSDDACSTAEVQPPRAVAVDAETKSLSSRSA